MIEIESLDAWRPERDVVMTIGSFDGLHRGHRHLLQQLVARAQETARLSAALTFFPHPRAVLQPGVSPSYLSTPQERRALMAKVGIDLLVVLPFTPQLARTSAEEFLRTLYTSLLLRELWVGGDFALGRGRQGNVAALQALAPQIGFTLRVVEPLYEEGLPISSTRIRALLAEGDVERAAQLLGRPYAFEAEVVRGFQRGRTLGFRTANLRILPEQAVPANGVYAVWALLEGLRWPAVGNIGIRPSFDAGERLLEVHLLDFEGDLYGQRLRVEFVQRLRPELRFDDVQALIAQVGRDIETARRLLGTPQPQAAAPTVARDAHG